MRVNTLKLMVLGAVAALSGLTACESSNSPTTGTTGSGGSSSTTSTTATTGSGTGGGADVCGGYETVTASDNASCKHTATDFDPKNTAGDGWAACKSDDGIFHPFDVNVGSDKRTVAFDEIGKLTKVVQPQVAAAPTQQLCRWSKQANISHRDSRPSIQRSFRMVMQP